MTDLETMLRTKLRTAVEPSPEPISVEAVTNRVRTRRRRLTTMAAVGGALAAAIPSVIIATGADDARDIHDTPAIRPTDVGIPAPAEVGSLPLGEPPSTPWSFGQTLHVGAQKIPVPGTGGPDVIGVVEGGWFLLVEREQFHPYAFRTEYGILHADGGFTPLPNLQRTGRPHVQEAAVSPDGDQVAGQAVVDANTGAIVARLPEQASYLIGWGRSGIVYDEAYEADGSAKSILWTPGSDPIPLAREVTDVVSGSSHVVTGKLGGCREVADLHSDGSLTTLWRGCHGLSPVLLSPDGTHVLTSNLSVVDIQTGEATRLFGADEPDHAAPDRAPSWQVVWEDSAHLLLTVDATWLVRCSALSLRCERAAGPLNITPGNDVNLIGPN